MKAQRLSAKDRECIECVLCVLETIQHFACFEFASWMSNLQVSTPKGIDLALQSCALQMHAQPYMHS